MIRQHIRFPPDPLAYAKLDFNPHSQEFKPSTIGLIINESFTGSAFIVYVESTPLSESEVRVQVGQVGPIMAKIVWVKELEPKVFKIGIQYKE